MSRLRLILLLPALLAAFAGGALGADQLSPVPTPVFDFEAVDFLASDALQPPPDAAGWRPLRLPDNWYVSRPEYVGRGWYRARFTLPPGPYAVHTIYAPRGAARNTAFFLNGVLVTNSRLQGDASALNWDAPIAFAVPPARLHPGENVFHVRVDAVAGLHQGLARFAFGPSSQIVPRYFRRMELQLGSLRAVGGAAGIAGLMALAFWRRSREDKVMFWFGVTALCWAAMALPWFNKQLGAPPLVSLWSSFPLRFAYATPLLVLCLRLAGRRSVLGEAAIWAFTLAGAAAMPFADESRHGAIVTIWSLAYLTALVALLAALLRRRAPSGVSHGMLLTGLALVVALNGADLARWMGWLDFDLPTLGHFHVPFVLLAIGSGIVQGHVRALAAVGAANRALAARIEAKTEEIAANDRRLRKAEQAAALARERSRIMADVHDGVGASLLGLLSAIRSGGRLVPAAIESRVLEALQELRLAVDALEPVDGDLGVVLGNVRYRLRQTLEQSGVRLVWQVGQLPPFAHLTPAAVQAIQRIVLEAIVNALRHARASTITLTTDVDAAGERLLIRIADDGQGFDPKQARRGRGLDNLEQRARRLGGKVTIASNAAGTAVGLALPFSDGSGQSAAQADLPVGATP